MRHKLAQICNYIPMNGVHLYAGILVSRFAELVGLPAMDTICLLLGRCVANGC